MCLTNKDAPKRHEVLKLRLKFTPIGGEVSSNYTLTTTPVAVNLKENKIQMVQHQDIGMTFNRQNINRPRRDECVAQKPLALI